jgi:hypothetical protein
MCEDDLGRITERTETVLGGLPQATAYEYDAQRYSSGLGSIADWFATELAEKGRSRTFHPPLGGTTRF